jgi:hypothetical protein
VVGRRAGKSRIGALVAVFLAAFRSYRDLLAPGERATVMLIAADRKQARTVFRYVAGLLDAVPMLAALVEHRTRERIDLRNGVTIEVHTCSYRAVRGYTIVAVVADEIAFWLDESSANPDVEVIGGLRPALATVPGGLLLCLSSPYARRGALWRAHKEHYGRERDEVLVWSAPTRAMNPLVAEAVVETALAEDPAAAASEFLAEFRRDVESFVTAEAVEAVIVRGRYELLEAAEVA